MADPFTEYYTGAMAPPMRMPDGTLVPAPNTVPSMTPAEIYKGILPAQQPSTALTTRPVNTVPINPQTGMPYVTQTAKSPLAAPGGGLSLAQMFAMRDPGFDSTKETVVAGGRREGAGFDAGHAYGPSYRLLPDEDGYGFADVPALDAATRVAENSFGLPRRRPVGAPAGSSLASLYDTGGVLGVGNDPWDGLRSPGEQRRNLSLDSSAPGGILSTFKPMGGAAAAVAAKPRGLLQTLADMFGSASAPQLAFNPAFATSAPGDGGVNAGISSQSEGRYGGALSLV